MSAFFYSKRKLAAASGRSWSTMVLPSGSVRLTWAGSVWMVRVQPSSSFSVRISWRARTASAKCLGDLIFMG